MTKGTHTRTCAYAGITFTFLLLRSVTLSPAITSTPCDRQHKCMSGRHQGNSTGQSPARTSSASFESKMQYSTVILPCGSTTTTAPAMSYETCPLGVPRGLESGERHTKREWGGQEGMGGPRGLRACVAVTTPTTTVVINNSAGMHLLLDQQKFYKRRNC